MEAWLRSIVAIGDVCRRGVVVVVCKDRNRGWAYLWTAYACDVAQNVGDCRLDEWVAVEVQVCVSVR